MPRCPVVFLSCGVLVFRVLRPGLFRELPEAAEQRISVFGRGFVTTIVLSRQIPRI